MRKTIRNPLFFLLAISVGLLAASFASMEASSKGNPYTFKLCYENTEQFPYHIGDTAKVLDPPGVSIDMIRIVGDKIGVKTEFTRAPWNQCLKQLQDGKVDGTFNGSFKKSRLKNGAYPMKNGKPDSSRRITTLSYSLYRLKGSNVNWDGKKLSGLSGFVGAPLGFSIVGDLKEMGAKVEESPSTYFDFKKLKKKRLDAVATLTVTGDSYLKKYPQKLEGIEKIKVPLVTKHYYLILSHQFLKNKPKVAKRVWKELSKVREKKLEALTVKYLK